ncbi:hypothetical protein C1645_845495 [Glomus cerebriforme]|uniref:Uncharacterized protein n=1 Tax=Glomus cerebriforme TaxID=658196 RepID=A0A397S4B5_9GLOM|nr:hypothetical protein C1645_845495 [Glomus cerebriforme]
MESLCDELKLEILRYTKTPILLIILNRNWYSTSQDPNARAEWLMYKYGRAHALFHAVRLGKSFITDNVAQSLIARGAIISRYFIQRLVMQFGIQDPKLDEMKVRYNSNVDNITPDCSWAASLPLSVFIKFMTEALHQLNGDISIKENDMELFQSLTAINLPINQASQIFFKNLSEIKDFILNHKFIPFPPRPKILPIAEQYHYPSWDGYENNKHIHLLSRAVLIYPDIVKCWKQIGYHEVCRDLNDIVIKGMFMMLFPMTPPANWVRPTPEFLAEKLKELIDIGFELNDDVIKSSIKIFKPKFDVMGETMIDSFVIIRGEHATEIAISALNEIAETKEY